MYYSYFRIQYCIGVLITVIDTITFFKLNRFGLTTKVGTSQRWREVLWGPGQLFFFSKAKISFTWRLSKWRLIYFLLIFGFSIVQLKKFLWIPFFFRINFLFLYEILGILDIKLRGRHGVSNFQNGGAQGSYPYCPAFLPMLELVYSIFITTILLSFLYKVLKNI